MTSSVATVQPATERMTQTATPARIDWAYFMDRRPATLDHHPDLPPYLLLPEVERLLAAMHHQVHHFLVNTLWHTGARISEVLQLTRGDFHLDGRYPEIAITTAKQRGRPTERARRKRRRVPVLDGAYIDEVLRYLATFKGGKKTPVFEVTRNTAYTWIKRAAQDLDAAGQGLSIPITPHTLRHTFAVNAVLHWVPLPVLQQWLGHERMESTVIYTQVLDTETVHFMERVSYHSTDRLTLGTGYTDVSPGTHPATLAQLD
jgi:integrase